MAAIIAYVQANWTLIASVLLGLSEVLALIPGVKANSVFQLIFNFISSIAAPKPAA